MKVLVTGSEGFVGRYFYRAYKMAGDTVLGIDVRNYAPVDARDFFRVNDDRFDLVIHCAAVVGGRAKIDRAPLEVAVDLAIDAELVQWALRTKPRRIVYFSSSAVYPVMLQTAKLARPLREADVWEGADISRPDMTYGWAKLTGEYQLGFLEAEGIKIHCFRPFSGYGPGQELDYPFPAFIQRAGAREDPFTIWGDGTQRRDFIHLYDIGSAVRAAIAQDLTGTVNLCSGVSTSFNELAVMVTEAIGYRPEFHHKLDAPVGVYSRVGDPKNMLSFYEPMIDLERGIAMGLDEYPW